MAPTKKDLFLPPTMRAEDNFRLSRFPDHQDCLWSNKSTKNPPKRYFHHGKWIDCKFKKPYVHHMGLLTSAFCSPRSPFQIKFDEMTGIGVYAKKDLSVRKHTNLVQSLSKGTYSTFDPKTKPTWSLVSLSIANSKRGRPKSEDTEKPLKKTRQTVSLLGPINFINHACMKHSQVKFFQDHSSKAVKVRMLKKIVSGQQVFMSYGSSFKGVKCLKCAAQRNKSKSTK